MIKPDKKKEEEKEKNRATTNEIERKRNEELNEEWKTRIRFDFKWKSQLFSLDIFQQPIFGSYSLLLPFRLAMRCFSIYISIPSAICPARLHVPPSHTNYFPCLCAWIHSNAEPLVCSKRTDDETIQYDHVFYFYCNRSTSCILKVSQFRMCVYLIISYSIRTSSSKIVRQEEGSEEEERNGICSIAVFYTQSGETHTIVHRIVQIKIYYICPVRKIHDRN